MNTKPSKEKRNNMDTVLDLNNGNWFSYKGKVYIRVAIVDSNFDDIVGIDAKSGLPLYLDDVDNDAIQPALSVFEDDVISIFKKF